MLRASCCPRRWQWPGASKSSTSLAKQVPMKCDADIVVIGASCASTETFVDQEGSVQSDDSPASPHFVPRPLTSEERQTAWTAANFTMASGDQVAPIALWILGPSSVGKSTIAVDAAPRFDIPCSSETDEGDPRQRLDAVIVDGEFMRDAHGIWKQWIETEDWRSAYPALKSVINQEKDQLCHTAVQQRKHLVIPQTALKLPKALAEMEELVRSGYTNHVLAVVAPLTECQQRGWRRELETGKRYSAAEFQKSISAIPPLIASSNGRYAVVRARERSGTLHGMDFDVLQEGSGGVAVSGLGTAAPPMAKLQAAISRAVQK